MIILNILKGLLEGFEKFIEVAGKISELTGKFVDFSNSSKDFANDVVTHDCRCVPFGYAALLGWSTRK